MPARLRGRKIAAACLRINDAPEKKGRPVARSALRCKWRDLDDRLHRPVAQKLLTLTSSMTNEVCAEPFSVPVNFSVTDLPT